MAFLLTAGSARGDSLLTADYETQLEAWLGGDFGFTLVYDNVVDGRGASDFHARVDGLGATITLVEVLRTQGNAAQVIGGYNPVSWDKTIGGWVLTPDVEDRNAFLFNLTLGTQQRQSLDSGYGAYQTQNRSNYHANFGGGNDMRLREYTGEAKCMSYGDGATNILGDLGYTSFDLDRVQTYTVVPLRASDPLVPEPASVCLLGAGIVALVAVRPRLASRCRR